MKRTRPTSSLHHREPLETRSGTRATATERAFGFPARRVLLVLSAFALCGAAGLWAGGVSAAPTALPAGAPAAAPAAQAGLPELTTLRLYGDSVVCDSCIVGQSNRPATAGADGVVDPNTGRVPEDPPYTDPRGPFSPLSAEAPRHDFVTWDPAWISERLGELNNPPLSEWACAGGLDEVSAASNIRAGGVNASEKVWLRHWYEPTHLDKDLNADDCLSDENLDGIPDAPSNPTASNDDEWYPAIMTELTYLLTENDLPRADPEGDEVDDQAPRPFCGEAGGTRWIFPVGTFAPATNPLGPLEGQGLTSLDADFDGAIDMVNVTSERELANTLGLTIDFDGDGIVDDLDPAGPLSCDAMVVMHTDALTIGTDGMLQFLDHYVRLRAASDNSATLEVWYNGDLQPRLVSTIALGQGSAALAGDVGPIPTADRINAGGDNLGSVPRGPWFVYLDATDAADNTATVMVGRALGAPCASMESTPNVANLSPGGPWHLKRFYVDGHEYNVTAIQTCSPTELQYITLRAPLPKVPTTIEQHSVRLQPYAAEDSLVLPPPYNYEHTILEDVVVVADDEIGPCPVYDPLANPFQTEPRPNIHYMGGPVGPVPPVLSDADGLVYTGRDPNRPVGPYDTFEDYLASHWFYVDEDVNPQMLGQLREKYGTGRIGGLEPVFANVAEDRLCEEQDAGGFVCSDTDTVGDGRGVAVGDFDGDNVVDLVYANVGGPNRVCLGDGMGGFACSDINADANDSEAVAVADVDGDGIPDAVFANSNGANRVCIGDGVGGFACSNVGADTRFSRDVALGDVTGDGELDAVFADFGANRVCVGNGAGGFVCSSVSVSIDSSEGVDLADLNLDGLLDAVFANTGATNRVCLNTGGGTFSCSDIEGLVEPSQEVALGDLNGDLVPDAIIANLGVENRLCFNDGSGAFTCDEFKPDLLNDTDVALGDIDGDGDLDAVFAVLDGPDRVCEADGSGGFSCTDVDPAINRAWSVALADVNGPAVPLDAFFFNEQMWTRPWNFTEFYLPDQSRFDGCDPDAYSVTTGFTNPTARWRLWSQPDGDVPDDVPPPPPDLVLDNTGYDPTTGQYGAPRRAGFVYDPDRMDPVYTSQDGVRLHGGWPDCPDGDCDGEDSRPDVQFGAGDVLATDTAGYPVEVPPYTDPFAPFNPQAPDAPRGDLLTFNPAYMDEFRNFGEPLRLLYQQLSNMSMNAREKVYQRAWYQPEYITKIRDFDDCDTDLSFPALMQEFTYLMMDTTDNPQAVPVPGSRLGFPIATGASELPRPNLGGSLPAGGEFGYGLTSFDADFDGYPEAVGLHTELSANDYFSTTFAANRPQPPIGIPVIPLPGATIDFDGDGIVTDTLDADCVSLNGNEMVVMTVESIVLDAEDDDPTFGHAAQFLDHMVVAENITSGSNPRAQLRFYFAGGTINEAVPEEVGLRTLNVGSVAIVDRFQDSIEVLDPGESNAGSTDGAWFVFVEDVSADGERVTLTLGRALGATHSAIDDGMGNHDLTPGDPWYLKRFYVDGHEYNVTALMTNNAPGADPTDPLACNDRFGFITIRTPVPKGNYFNPQDSLFQQGYFLDGLTPQMSVMPPFNVDHTIVEDVERIEANEFANLNFFDACVGTLAAAGPQVQEITEEEPELRFGQELRETYRPAEGTNPLAPRFEDGWETHQLAVTPGDYTEIKLPEGETYLLTLNWRSEVSRLSFYGCTRDEPGPFDDEEFPPQISHDDVAMAAAPWDPALIPAVNRFDPPVLDEDANGIQDITPYFDARCSVTETVRVKLFYDPTEDDDLYVNKRPIPELPPIADVQIEKVAQNSTPAAGDDVTYQLTVTNNGPDDVDTANVVDDLPAGVSYISDTDSCVPAGTDPERLNCTVGPIASGDSEVFFVTARLDADLATGTALLNFASVTVPGGFDDDMSNNSDDDEITVTKRADLSVTKTAGEATPAAGTQLVYTIVAENLGPSDVTGVTVMDDLPPEVDFVSTSRPDICQLFGTDRVACYIDALDAGESIPILITVDIPAAVPPGTRLDNRVEIGSATDDPNPGNDVAEEDVLVISRADLWLEKSASPDPVTAGERLTYTLTVHNDGPSNAPAVEVVDTLSSDVAYAGASGAACAGVAIGASGTLTCQVGPLASGAMASFEIYVEVDPSLPNGATVSNSAVVNGPGSTDPDPGDNDDDVTVDIETRADLRLSKDAPDEVFPGSEFDWTVTVFNDGPSDAANAIVSDDVPAGTTYVSASGATCAGVAPGGTGTLTCAVGTVPANDSVAFTIRLRVEDGATDGQIITNNASVSSSTPDPDGGNNDATDTTTVRRLADLAIVKEAIGQAVAGAELTYSINVQNFGPATATGVVVTDQLPAGMSFVSSTGGCVEAPPASGALSCALPDLPSGGSLNFTITALLEADLAAGVQLVNDAKVDGTTNDPVPGNNEDDAPVTIVRDSDLATTKSDDVDPVAAGEDLTYTIEVTNNGPSDAANVVVVDTLPAGTSFVSSTGGCVEAPVGTLTCALGNLADGASTSFEVVVSVDAAVADGTVLVNTAEADSDSEDSSSGNDSDSESTLVAAVADMRMLKTALDTAPLAGTSFAFTIQVTNGGPSDATDVTVVDVLPAGLSYVSDTGGCVESPADTLTCSLGSLASGASTSFNVVVAVDASVADGTVITNTATVSTTADDPDSGNDSDDAAVTVGTEADLAVDKTAPANAEPGQQINYTLTVDNNGPSDAVGVMVVDTLPSEVSYVGAVGATCVEAPAGTLTCDVGTIAAGDQVVITITVDIDGGVPDMTVITNDVTVDSDTDDPNGGDNTDDADTTVELRNEADLRLTKVALDTAPGVGEIFSYQVNVFNDGPRTATNVIITDTLPVGVTYQFDSDSCIEGPVGTLVCSAPDLVSGGSYSFTITVLADASTPAGSQLTNTAETSSDIPDPDTGNNSDSAIVTLQPRTDLRMTKSASSDPVAAGEELTYTLTVFNDGPSEATGVTVTDTLPAGVSYVSDDAGCSTAGLPTLVCDLGTIASGASASAVVVVQVDGGLAAGTQLTNNATTGGDQPDPDDGNNDAQETVDVERRTDLAIDKSASHALRAPGQLVTFTLSVDNLGPSDATGVTVTDTLPAGLGYESDDAGCDTSGLPQIVCSLGNLAAGASDSVTIVARVDLGATAGQMLTNVAVVGGDDPDPNGGNDDDDETVEVTALADLRVSKSGAGAVTTAGDPPGTAIILDAVSAGRRLTYTLSVTNDGPSDATGVTVTDDLPAGVSYVSDDSGCDTSGLPQILCSIGALASGATATVTIVVDVDASLADGALLVNDVSVGGNEADPDGGNDSDDQTTTVSADSDLDLSKTASTDKAAVGATVTFTLVVENLGPSDAAGVTVTDTLPAGVTYVSDTGGCDTSGLPEVVCDLGGMAAGAIATVEIVVTIDGGTEGQTLSNTAVVGLDGGDDPNPDNNDDGDDVDVEEQLDLRIGKVGAGEVVTVGNPPGLTVLADRVTAGQLLTYTLNVTNAGPATATGLVVEDTLPAGVGFIAADPACDTSGLPLLSCPLSDLGSGASTTLSIVVGVDDDVAHGSVLTNTASVDSNQVDSNPADNDDSQQTLVDAAADLTVMKTAEPSTAGTGELVTFTITAANAGPSTAVGVTVTDTLPAALGYVSDDGGCDTSGLPLVVCDLGDLGPGDLASVEIVVEVQPGFEDSTVNNTVIVGPSEGSDPDPSDNGDDEPVTIPPRVDLGVSKAGAGEVSVPGNPPGTAVVPNLVSAGRRLTYTLSVDNAGPSTATGVVLTDTLPAGVSLVSTSGASCSPTPPGVVCDLPDLAMGAGVVVTVVVDVDEAVADGSVLTNEAAVTSDEDDANESDNTDSQLTDVSADADLSIDKAAEPAIVASGELVTFTLTVINQGPSVAKSVVVTDTLPAGMTDVSADPGCDVSGAPVVVCTLGDMTPGAMTTLQITARPTAALETLVVINEADVDSDTDDPNPDDNHAEASFGVAIPVDLAVAKSGVGEVLTAGNPPGISLVDGEVAAGGLITWTILVTNAGLQTATGVVLTDTLPANVSHVSDDAGCDTSGTPTIVCALGSLASGASTSVTMVGLVKAVVPAGTILTNTAVVAAGQMEMSTGDNTATHETLVREQADLALDKSANPPWLQTGDEVTYTIAVTNNGPSLARDVRVTDTLPASLTYVSDTDACVETPPASGTLVCLPGDIMPGLTTSFEIVARVEAGLTGQRVTNTARAGLPAPAVDPNPANDEDSAGSDVVDPLQSADLTIKKSINSTLSMTGELITYTIQVNNDGPLLADQVVVTDVLTMSTDGMAMLIDASHGGCTIHDAENMTCDLGDMASGSQIDYTVTAFLNFVPPTGSHFVTNTVDVASLTPDIDLTNNNGFAWFEIMGGAFMVGTFLDPGDTITLAWMDDWTQETEFRIEAKGAGSPWLPVAAVPSRSTASRGSDYRWTSPRLPAGSRTAFRVVVHDPVGAAMSPLASVGRYADVARRPASQTGCYVGQLGLDGRSRHDGAIVRLDGIPVAHTTRGGDFRLCGVSPGLHDLSTWQAGYLAVAARTSVAVGRDTELPWVALPGGDINGDGKVDLADLVLVGAAYDAVIDADAAATVVAADLNGDAKVDLFDLVMVSGSYDRFGPLPWWDDASVPEVMAGAVGEPDASGLPEATLSLQTTAQEDGRHVVRLAARNVRDVFGADLRLRLDPSRARWVDVDPDEPGLQVATGASWWTGGDNAAYVARNVADRDGAALRFAATRTRPATSMRGDLVLATVVLEPVGDESSPEEALTVLSARLLTPGADEIPVRVSGVEVGPPGGGGARTIYLPFVQQKR